MLLLRSRAGGRIICRKNREENTKLFPKQKLFSSSLTELIESQTSSNSPGFSFSISPGPTRRVYVFMSLKFLVSQKSYFWTFGENGSSRKRGKSRLMLEEGEEEATIPEPNDGYFWQTRETLRQGSCYTNVKRKEFRVG